MVSIVNFLGAVGIAVLIVLLLGGLLYWIAFFIFRMFPYLKYEILYKIFRKKYDPLIVDWCANSYHKGLLEGDILKRTLLGESDYNKAKERAFIFKECKKKLERSEKPIKNIQRKVKGGLDKRE